MKAVHLLLDLGVYPGTQHRSVWVIMLANTCGASTELSVKDERKKSRDLREERKLSKDFLALNIWRGWERKAVYLT